jgi:hypothetical protein
MGHAFGEEIFRYSQSMAGEGMADRRKPDGAADARPTPQHRMVLSAASI